MPLYRRIYLRADRKWKLSAALYSSNITMKLTVHNIHMLDDLLRVLFKGTGIKRKHVERKNCNIPHCYCVFTARKRSFRRLCFHRCLCVHGGVSVTHTQPLGPEADTCPAQCMLGHTHPPAQCMLGHTSPWLILRDTVNKRGYASHWNAFLFICIFLFPLWMGS